MRNSGFHKKFSSTVFIHCSPLLVLDTLTAFTLYQTIFPSNSWSLRFSFSFRDTSQYLLWNLFSPILTTHSVLWSELHLSHYIEYKSVNSVWLSFIHIPNSRRHIFRSNKCIQHLLSFYCQCITCVGCVSLTKVLLNIVFVLLVSTRDLKYFFSPE